MNAEDTNRNRAAGPLSEEKPAHAPQPDLTEDSPEPPQKGWRRYLLPALIVLFLLGGIGWIVLRQIILPLIFLSQMKPQPTLVQLGSPKSASVAESSDYVARLQSRQSVTLQPRVSGQISRIYVKSGDRVEAGTPILQIDAAEQRAQVQSRTAAVETAAANIASAEAEVANARDTLQSLQANRQAALADLQRYQREYSRYEAIVREGAESRQVLDEKLNALRSAQAGVREIDAQIRAQNATIARNKAAVQSSKRSLDQARANVDEGQAQLQYYTITAPFAGTVGDIPVKEGDFVDTAKQLLTLTQNERLEIEISVSLDRAGDLRRGLPVQLLDDNDKVLQTGEIFFVSPDVDAGTQSVLAKAAFDNSQGKLRTNQFPRARVIWDTRPGVLVPTPIISRLGGREFVFVAAPFKNSGCNELARAEGGPPAKEKPNPEQLVAVQKAVKLGKIVGNDQEVLEGINQSDRIITSGILQLQNCMAITDQPPKQ